MSAADLTGGRGRAAPGEARVVDSPSLRRTVWRRLRRDRLALAAAVFLLLLVLACFVGAPLAARALGHGPTEYFPQATNYVSSGSFSTLQPVGPWTWVANHGAGGSAAKTGKTLFILGADGPLGHDELLQLLYGGRTTLEIAFGATLVALFIGIVLGTAAGFFGGRTDLFASRLSEFVAAFPLLLLVTAIGWTIGARLNGITLGVFPQGVLALIVVLGAFTWPYPARIVRAQVVELRQREFIDAARVIGSGQWRTIRVHVLPYLAAPLLVYGSLIFAANVVLEAALSALNLGLQLDVPDWGAMLSQNWGTLIFNNANGGTATVQGTAWTQAFPAVAILLTIVALGLVGESLRQAINPDPDPR
jgi:peptide/nickel transport system permease protein